MKRLILLVLLITLLSSCKKDDNPNNYIPKKGDSVELLVKMWGEPGNRSGRPGVDWIYYTYYPPKSKVIEIRFEKIYSIEELKPDTK